MANKDKYEMREYRTKAEEGLDTCSCLGCNHKATQFVAGMQLCNGHRIIACPECGGVDYRFVGGNRREGREFQCINCQAIFSHTEDWGCHTLRKGGKPGAHGRDNNDRATNPGRVPGRGRGKDVRPVRSITNSRD